MTSGQRHDDADAVRPRQPERYEQARDAGAIGCRAWRMGNHAEATSAGRVVRVHQRTESSGHIGDPLGRLGTSPARIELARATGRRHVRGWGEHVAYDGGRDRVATGRAYLALDDEAGACRSAGAWLGWYAGQ